MHTSYHDGFQGLTKQLVYGTEQSLALTTIQVNSNILLLLLPTLALSDTPAIITDVSCAVRSGRV